MRREDEEDGVCGTDDMTTLGRGRGWRGERRGEMGKGRENVKNKE
jgi:hypothetical protein